MGPVLAAGEPVSGTPPVAEGAAELLGEGAGALVSVTAWVPSGDELTLGAVLGLADVVPVTVAADVVTVVPAAVVVLVDGAGVAVVQSAVGAGPGGFVVWLGLLAGLELAELLSLGLEAGELLSLGLEAGELLSLGLEAGELLSDGLASGLAVPLSVALGEMSGATDTVGLAGALVLAELDALGDLDGCVLAVAHPVLDAVNPGMLLPAEGGVLPEALGEPSPSVELVPLVGAEPVMSALICETPSTTSCRVVGTAASTTPRTNTAMPVAKAGRSIASRQSRCGPRPDEPGPDAWRAGHSGRIRSASRPAQPGNRAPKSRTASHTAIAP